VTPFELRPIELLANPVLTCATATDAGYPSNFFANLFLYVQVSHLLLLSLCFCIKCLSFIV
jgi:hypothetical protein